MKIHPDAAEFPALSPERYRSLKEHIRNHGLQDPIVLFKGEIIDGQHRLRICQELGIEPIFHEWQPTNGMTVREFIIGKNLERRHLDANQWTYILARLMPKLKEEAKVRKSEGQRAGGKARHGQLVTKSSPKLRASDVAAKQAGVSHSKIDQAVKVSKARPDLAEKVIAGQMTHASAMREVFPTMKEQAANHPSVTWLKHLQTMDAWIAGMSRHGGIESVVQSWTKQERKYFLAEIISIMEGLSQWKSQLEKS